MGVAPANVKARGSPLSGQVACTSKACGALNRSGDEQCHACGRPLPEPTEAEPAEAEAEAEPAAPATYETKSVLGWLCCAPLAPVPLGPKPKVIIGRSSECDLVLRHPSVSRHHCTVTVREGGMSMLDEGSSNGSYLNGKRASQSNLVPGDVLSLGCFEVEVRSNDMMAAAEQDLDMEGTRVVTLSNVTTHLLHEISMAETLQGMEFNRRSGTLRLLSGQLRGALVISQGRPLWATLGQWTGDEAVLKMLELDSSVIKPRDFKNFERI